MHRTGIAAALIVLGAGLAATCPVATTAASASELRWKDAVLAAERYRLNGDPERAAVMVEHLIRENGPHTETEAVFAYHKLGFLYHEMRRFYDAERYYRRALKTANRLAGFNARAYSRILNDLTVLYLETWQHSKIDIPHLEAIATRQDGESPGDIDVDVARAHSAIAEVHAFYKRYAKGEPHFQRALQIFREKGEFASAANVLGSMGAVRTETGRYDEALQYYREAMTTLDRADRPEAAARVCLLSNIAATYRHLHRPEAALPYIEAAVHLSESAFGSDHPAGAAILGNYAEILRALNRKKEARSVEQRAKAIGARYVRKNHSNSVVDVRDFDMLSSRR